ncbi:diguanylate cyclase (GGDEF) domain-containing protein [Alkalibacterium subtropicum]|uniref:Diguanylate cyclase (GGDEF) domain-containing protein n=1 Tax=Alkalibacterium subtropicum TaxID=753702 RepID=A0A1I1HIC7_9LACT|nr:sensor domain-containing diguanylate cyclase [Alkalibacterium subtropicum]SFC23601.1 diguanylate cyclase (GGDEF) domain-containing protein [Alkalibacterium subtropicum]
MLSNKKINVTAGLFIILPLVVYYYLVNNVSEMSMNIDLHFYYVIFSSAIALLVGFSAYKEYKKSRVTKIFFIAIGFLGVGVFYTFHALTTPDTAIAQRFNFPHIIDNINVFVLFGDLSRFWLALMLFVPDTLLEHNDRIRKYFNGYMLLFLLILLSGGSYYAVFNPEILPAFKHSDLRDTYFAILTKVITLIFIGINALKYYYSYKVKSNITILSFLIGLCLIMESTIMFMISTPWSSVWWLAHNLFLLSYIVMGFGLLYSYTGKEKYEYFDILGQIKKYAKLLEEKNTQLNTLVNYDALTGLSNRRHFMAALGDYIERAEKNHDSFALMFIDLDYFKTVNDRFGHQVGDELLKKVSEKISKSIHSKDMASRIGGDEFVVLLNKAQKGHIKHTAERILDKLTKPIVVNGNECHIGASIGISVYPVHGETVDELISKSDEAMYCIKKDGRNSYKIAENEKAETTFGGL